MAPCENCHAGCCRSFAIPITGADIIRIERGLNLNFWDFACRWADPDGKIALKYAPHFFFEDDPETPYVICLEHQQSHFRPRTTKCRFLTEGQPDDENPLGQARCGIYHQRPAACRVFPTKLNDTGDLAILHDIPDTARNADEPVYDLCPSTWKASDLDSISTMQTLVIAKFEMVFFQQLADIWNRKPRPWRVFPEFLRLVYEKRVTVETADELDDAPEPEIIKIHTAAAHGREKSRKVA
ncbi:MAG: hypothetical protein Tsb009_28260 [Planctomycetaceae bacterium]